MMIFSRFWYAIIAVLAGFAVYSLMLAVGQYNRQSIKGTNEALAGDSRTVRWDIQIDSRRRIDARLQPLHQHRLSLVGVPAVDPHHQDARRDRAAEMRVLSEGYADRGAAGIMNRLADDYDRLAERADERARRDPEHQGPSAIPRKDRV